VWNRTYVLYTREKLSIYNHDNINYLLDIFMKEPLLVRYHIFLIVSVLGISWFVSNESIFEFFSNFIIAWLLKRRLIRKNLELSIFEEIIPFPRYFHFFWKRSISIWTNYDINWNSWMINCIIKWFRHLGEYLYLLFLFFLCTTRDPIWSDLWIKIISFFSKIHYKNNLDCKLHHAMT